MVHDPRVSHALARLGGVYRDPNRVDRDAAALLKSSVGAHLAPIISEMVATENGGGGGSNNNVLVLQGTVAMHFRGNTYQQLVDVYLPPGYPNRPPVCFVRLASPNMYLKENHRHVGNDGKVYLPYLHEWNRQTHNLVELVVAMSSVFSADPPVFTRSSAQQQQQQSTSTTAATTASSSSSNAARISPPPPPPPPSMPDPPPPIPSSWQTESAREAILAVEIATANEAAEVARRAELEEQERARRERLEREREEERARQRREAGQREEARQRQVKQAVETKLRQYLLGKVQECRQQVAADARDAQRLEYSETKISQQAESLTGQREELERQVAAVDKKLEDIKAWLEANNNQKAENGGNVEADEPEEMSIDDVVQASNPLQAQMIELSAENHALSDTLYLVDQALYRGHVDAETHLKQVRKLAKRQFLVRAHLHKIQHVMLQAPTGRR